MVQTHRLKVIAITGCTAVGKSETAIKIAQRFNGAIIGADSMQIYKKFNIGTGKVTQDEQCGVSHSLIDIINGDEEFSVGEYVDYATNVIQKISNSGKLPILVGGTGLYINALFSGCNFANSPKNQNLRNELKLLAHFFGKKLIFDALTNVDALSANKIAQNDVKRVIRALEIFLLNGKPKSTVINTDKPFDDLTIVLTLPREILYNKINARVQKMFDDGLIDEVNSLKEYVGKQSFQAIGYKQVAENPQMSKEELVELVARKSRNYAKRQTTYFKNVNLNKVFIDARDYEQIVKTVNNFIGVQNG